MEVSYYIVGVMKNDIEGGVGKDDTG